MRQKTFVLVCFESGMDWLFFFRWIVFLSTTGLYWLIITFLVSFFNLFYLYFFETVLFSPGWPELCVDQAGLTLKRSACLASQVLGLKMSATAAQLGRSSFTKQFKKLPSSSIFLELSSFIWFFGVYLVKVVHNRDSRFTLVFSSFYYY